MKLLDTDICIHFLIAREPHLIERYRAHAPTELVLSSIVRAELRFGARRSARVTENLERGSLFAEPSRILPFDDRCADAYSIIRSRLAQAGTPFGSNALLIAATGVAFACTLVTRHRREFERIPGLQIEIW